MCIELLLLSTSEAVRQLAINSAEEGDCGILLRHLLSIWKFEAFCVEMFAGLHNPICVWELPQTERANVQSRAFVHATSVMCKVGHVSHLDSLLARYIPILEKLHSLCKIDELVVSQLLHVIATMRTGYGDV